LKRLGSFTNNGVYDFLADVRSRI